MKASLLVDEEDVDAMDQRFGHIPSKGETVQEICSPRLPISASHSSKSRSIGTV
jgi:nuclear pore complex protein Nup98-Nup96